MAILLEDIVESVELWLNFMRKKPQPYVDPDLDPVLLVPGVAGTVLNAVDEKGKEERVWVRILGADYKFRTKLWSRFDSSTGKTVCLDPKTSIMVPEDRYGLHAIDVLDPDLVIGRESVYYFHDMIVEMIKWGFQEGKTLFGFGYDFRQSNRFQETLERLAAKIESVFTASGGKKLNIISHSMGGLLVKCFMCLHSDIFEKYVKNWIAIAAPFQGAPGYVTSTVLNGMSFVEGWEQNFFISKWNMHQLLIECPSIYELMACPDFCWEHNPLLEIWRQHCDNDGNSNVMLESYSPEESISIFTEALASNTVNYDGEDIPLPFNLEILKWANETRKVLCCAKLPPQVKFYNIYGTDLETPHSVCYGSAEAPVTDLQQLQFLKAKYICVDGDGTVPVESAQADGLDAEARVGVPGEHRGILCDRHVFRILQHWLNAGDPDPYYNPLNDYVVLPTLFEIERHQEKGFQITSLKEEWEIIGEDQDNQKETAANKKPLVSSICLSNAGVDQSVREEARAMVIVHPQSEGRQHVQLNAVSVTANA
ncbi:Lecithin-cholesterol acyltransferase-like [Actinidia chinensis var. chinensis]|uniref:Lecithin-cholesterol acyltransferase-like n=1 Tax=Actinidia chinensis var. chinensis TaxID=1590841 RepID=A0A2R6P9I0_ACTCC|nr:Lecithin-cholesterol acyltransferase-like [Actinidia chinensis var. chinensis]